MASRNLVRPLVLSVPVAATYVWLAVACGGGSTGAPADGGSDGGPEAGPIYETSIGSDAAIDVIPDYGMRMDTGIDVPIYPDAPSGPAVFEPVGAPTMTLTSLSPALTVAPFAVVVADFNGDHLPDVVATAGMATFDNDDQTAPQNIDSSTTVLLLGKGDGTFMTATTVVAAHTMTALLAGDLNDHQKVDLVAGGQVFLGVGNGTFTTPASQPTVGCVGALGDVNHDGNLDLVGYDSHAVVGDAGTGQGAVCLGKGDGTFQAPIAFATATLLPTAILVGDLNGDNLADVLVAQDGLGGTPALSVFLATASGALGAEQSIAVATISPGDLHTTVLADVTGDGILDVTSSSTSPASMHEAVPTVAILAGKGDGTFLPAVQVRAPLALNPTAGNLNGIAVSDINGDGHPDLLFGSEDDPLLWVTLSGNPATPIQFSVPYLNAASTTTPRAEPAADFNNDGIPDLLVLQGNALQVVLAKAKGSFAAASQGYVVASGALSLSAADFNGDGISDLAVTGGATLGGVDVFLSSTGGTYLVPPVTLTPMSTTNPASAVGDFNGDHFIDLAVAETGGVGIFLGKTGGAFAQEELAAGMTPVGIEVIDLNGDHAPDLVVGTSTGVETLLNKGNGTFSPGVVAASALSGPNAFGVGEYQRRWRARPGVLDEHLQRRHRFDDHVRAESRQGRRDLHRRAHDHDPQRRAWRCSDAGRHQRRQEPRPPHLFERRLIPTRGRSLSWRRKRDVHPGSRAAAHHQRPGERGPDRRWKLPGNRAHRRGGWCGEGRRSARRPSG